MLSKHCWISPAMKRESGHCTTFLNGIDGSADLQFGGLSRGLGLKTEEGVRVWVDMDFKGFSQTF